MAFWAFLGGALSSKAGGMAVSQVAKGLSNKGGDSGMLAQQGQQMPQEQPMQDNTIVRNKVTLPVNRGLGGRR